MSTHNEERRAELSRMNLFADVSTDSIEHYFAEMGEMRLEGGQVLLAPGQPNKRIYLVAEGRLRVHLDVPDEPPLLLLGPGECVGEMSIIENNGASAFVVAEEPSRVLTVEQKTLWGLVNASHGVARNLLMILSRRVRFDNGVIVDGLAMQRQWEHYASVDALTGLHNRRWLDEVLDRQIRRSQKDRQPLSALMLDIDRFKDYNDRHGHLGGDEAMRALARVLRKNLRPNDLAARFGGEEFFVLLPATALEVAEEIAERLRRAVRVSAIHTADGEPLPPITVSIGVATLGTEDGAEALISAVDAALYRAKAAGRDCISP